MEQNDEKFILGEKGKLLAKKKLSQDVVKIIENYLQKKISYFLHFRLFDFLYHFLLRLP